MLPGLSRQVVLGLPLAGCAAAPDAHGPGRRCGTRWPCRGAGARAGCWHLRTTSSVFSAMTPGCWSWPLRAGAGSAPARGQQKTLRPRDGCRVTFAASARPGLGPGTGPERARPVEGNFASLTQLRLQCLRGWAALLRRPAAAGVLSPSRESGHQVDELRRHCNHLGRGVTARTQLVEEGPGEDSWSAFGVSAHGPGTRGVPATRATSLF